jgi:hypothetical protein
MSITGHKTRSIWDRYRIVSERDLRDAAAMMDRPVPAVKHEFPPEQGEQVKGAETAPERPN